MSRISSPVKVFCALSFMFLACIAWSQSNVSIFADGLNNPRGLKFGSDGNLYVAEGGPGGNISSAGLCDQVVPPIGPYKGGFTARISKISPNGTRTTVVDGLPSDQTSAGSGTLVVGSPMLHFSMAICTRSLRAPDAHTGSRGRTMA